MKGFDEQYYQDLILKALKEHKSLKRSDFNKLVINKLPNILNMEQKRTKVGNLLKKLRIEGKLYADEHRIWHLTE